MLKSKLPLLITFLSFSVLATTSNCLSPPGSSLNRLSGSNNYLTTAEFWFDQTLHHFSPYDHRRFNQRYYEFLDYFTQSDGPIFLKICGESACNGIVNDYISVLAKKFGAAVVSLEHRYYGKSTPFKTTETKNLQ